MDTSMTFILVIGVVGLLVFTLIVGVFVVEKQDSDDKNEPTQFHLYECKGHLPYGNYVRVFVVVCNKSFKLRTEYLNDGKYLADIPQYGDEHPRSNLYVVDYVGFTVEKHCMFVVVNYTKKKL